jgi:hypothetical protein
MTSALREMSFISSDFEKIHRDQRAAVRPHVEWMRNDTRGYE